METTTVGELVITAPDLDPDSLDAFADQHWEMPSLPGTVWRTM